MNHFRHGGQEKTEQAEMIQNIAVKTSSNLVMVIGHIGAFYRAAKEPKIILPKK